MSSLEENLRALFFDQDQAFLEEATEILLSSPNKDKFAKLIATPDALRQLKAYFFGSYPLVLRRELDVLECCPPVGGDFL